MGNAEARLHKMGGQANKKKLDKQVKAIQSRINQLEVKEKPKEESPIVLNVEETEKIHAKVLVQADHLQKSFGHKVIFNDAHFTIKNNSHVALIGGNGTGKTTLLKMILEGASLWVHPNLKIGYYSQMSETVEGSLSILDNVLESSIYDQTRTRIVLARLGFQGDEVFKEICLLSDGERAKVKLAKLLTSDFLPSARNCRWRFQKRKEKSWKWNIRVC